MKKTNESSVDIKRENRLQILEVFDNPAPDRNYYIKHVATEFTSLCPKTGHPDFAKFSFKYIPSELCVELKSLKLYLQDFRNEGAFFEALFNLIMEDFIKVVQPHYLELKAIFNVRGGIYSVLNATYESEEYKQEELDELDTLLSYEDDFDEEFDDDDDEFKEDFDDDEDELNRKTIH